MARIHLTGKHALKFQLLDIGLHALEVCGDYRQHLLVLFLDCQFQHFTGISKAMLQAVQGRYDGIQPGSLTSQALRVLRFIPDRGVFKLAIDFLQAVAFPGIVKDTP